VLLGTYFGGQIGLQLRIPVWQPLRTPGLGGSLFIQPEAGMVFFNTDTTFGTTVHNFGGLFALTTGWHQHLSIFSITPRIGPAVLWVRQYGDYIDPYTTSAVLGLVGLDLAVRLGGFSVTLGADFLFDSRAGVWLPKIAFTF
jgi:hypothetical protein